MHLARPLAATKTEGLVLSVIPSIVTLRALRLGEKSFFKAVDDTSDALFDQWDIEVDQ